MSFMTVTQQQLEALSSAAQVRSHGELRHAGPPRYLADRGIGVVVEDHRGALSVGKLGESPEQLRVQLGVEVRPIRNDVVVLRAVLELAGGDLEPRLPDPRARIPNGRATADGLGERL